MTGLPGPHVRLALGGAVKRLKMALQPVPGELQPALLCSYVYLNLLVGHQHEYSYRDWSLDSGAFSAHQLGIKIELAQYIAKCHELFATDPKLTECFSLDVIGDWRGSERNTEQMWKAGVQAIPVYHHGEPEALLKHMASAYPKIAIGGAVGLVASVKQKWAEQCFARVWPKKIHGLGFGSELAAMGLPFHSMDATNWQAGPTRFGSWKTFGSMSVRGGSQNVRCEVDWYLALERKARSRWRKEMEALERV